MKIALAFYGLTRSLFYTISSIRKNILNILIKNGIEYDIFLHTYRVTSYQNQRSQEKTVHINNEEYKLVAPNYIEIDDQDDIKEKLNLKHFRTHPDPWNTNYQSVDNFILAQYSKSRVTALIRQPYDYILYLRPDVEYISPFNITYLYKATDHTLCIPDFHQYGPHLFNDRFCITTQKTYVQYGNIYPLLLEISKREPLHSETVLGAIMIEYGLSFVSIPFHFIRVRYNGIKEERDVQEFSKIDLQPVILGNQNGKLHVSRNK